MMLNGKMALDGKNIAVLTGERVDDYAVEIGEIIRAMKDMGARVRVVSSSKKRLGRGLAGAVRVDIAIDKVKAGDFDAIVLGTNCRNSNAREHLFCIRFLNEAYEQGKLVAAIGKGLEPVLAGPAAARGVAAARPGGLQL